MADLPPLPIPCRPQPLPGAQPHRLYDSPWIRLREDRYRAPPRRRGPLRGLRLPAHRLRRPGPGRRGPGGAGGPVALPPGGLFLGAARRRRRGGREPPGGHPAGTAGGGRASPPRVWEPLAFCHNSNSSTDEETFLFLARDLAPAAGRPRARRTDEELALPREPFAQCVARVLARGAHRRPHRGGPAGPAGPPGAAPGPPWTRPWRSGSSRPRPAPEPGTGPLE